MPSTSRNEQDRDASLSARETPLPWGKLTVLLAVRLAEPIGMTLILPFMYQMVGGFDVVKDPKDISFYAGMLLTSFSIFKALTVMHWGILSDRIGRRPVILLGLLGNLLTFVLFGVSKSFKWALVARSLNGMFTGNSVVIKTVVAEISDSTNRPRMMALLPLMWNLGMMLGGAVGGALVDPVAKYPWLFGGSVLFREYPYLLPCLVGSTASFFGLVVGFFQLEETLVIRPSTGSTASVGRPATETTALVLDAQNEEGRDQPAVTERTPSKWAILTPTVIRVLATNTIMCLAIAMHNQIYPIYAATDIADGGLGMDAQSIGYTLTFCGILVVYFQLVMYPILADKYGALACYRRGLLLLALFSTTFPLLSILVKYTGDKVRIPRIGLGTTAMSYLYGPFDDDESVKVLNHSIDIGCNFLDTADIYGLGHNEKLISRVLKERRKDVFLCTKFGIVTREPLPGETGVFTKYNIGTNGSPEYMRRCIEASIERLGTDYIDLYYLHDMDPSVPIEETVAAMAELIKEGK
ncbi:hypothetical protein GGH99_002495, partial [Coemansia sp. RSA 1285]